MKSAICWIWVLALAVASARAAVVQVGTFSAGSLDGWESKSFRGDTRYEIQQDGDTWVVHARSREAASGLFRKVDIDLRATPYLNWSWRVANLLNGLDERTRDGDDYPARIYVIYSTGPFFWQTAAINYVWSSAQASENTWANAFTERSTMVAVRGNTDAPGAWRQERRDVRADIRRLTGREVTHIDAIAIMTDTDNSGQAAEAWYGDIFFSSQ